MVKQFGGKWKWSKKKQAWVMKWKLRKVVQTLELSETEWGKGFDEGYAEGQRDAALGLTE